MNTLIDLAMTGWEAFRALPSAAQTGIAAIAGLVCTGLVLSRRPTDQVRQSV